MMGRSRYFECLQLSVEGRAPDNPPSRRLEESSTGMSRREANHLALDLVEWANLSVVRKQR
jgi:hypothetical protein